MRRWWLIGCSLLVLAGCGGGVDDEQGAAAAGEVTAFEWETVLDQDGYGYVLTVEGLVGDGWAAYDLQVEPTFGTDGGDYADFLAVLAGTTVNGLAEEGEGVGPTGEIDPDGRTEVRVVDGDRWYRNPWLLDEAAFAMGDAEWVRVPGAGAVIVDAATAVLNERYDDALRRLLEAIRSGTPLEAPTPEESDAQLDEVLTPWIGLAGPAYPDGAEATVTGDADEGGATWRDELTYEPDGSDGEMAGTVRWRPGTGEAPTRPQGAIDVADVTAGMGG